MDTPTWTLRVTSPDGRTARVATRRHQFAVTRPLDFDVEHDGLTALQYALGALGAELVTGLRELARRRRLVLDDVEAVVTGELDNALTYLEVIGETGHAGIARVRVKLFVSSPEPGHAVRQLFDRALEVLPLARTFRQLVELDVQLAQTP